jgi:hypothetical protein
VDSKAWGGPFFEGAHISSLFYMKFIFRLGFFDKPFLKSSLSASKLPNAYYFAIYKGSLVEKFKFKFKILGSECQTSGTYAKRAKQAT